MVASTLHRDRDAAVRTIKRAGAWSLLLHCCVVAGLGVSSGLRGQVAPLTDVSAEASLEVMFAEPTPPAPPEVSTPPEEPVVQAAPPQPTPEEPTRPALDDVFGKMVEALPPPSDVPPSMTAEPLTNVAKWVEVPPPPPPPSEPVASFAGVEARPARRIVYLIDGSGSMAASLNFVKSELASSVARLSSDQSFQVIVYRQPAGGGGSPISYYFFNGGGEPDLIDASLEEKQRLRAWLETVSPGGRSEPLLGLEAALRLQPDLIFILTRNIARSGGVDVQQRNRQILDTLDRINPRQLLGGRLAKIKTIQFLDDDPTGLMQAIASEHGDGGYRVVTRSEVANRER